MENEVPPPSQPMPPAAPAGGEQIPPPPVNSELPFQRPADYYSSGLPPASERKGCPRWVPIGCGLGGCLVLVVMFVLGALIVKDTSGRFSGWFLARLEKETLQLVAKDVPPQQREALRQQFTTLRANIKQGKASFVEMQTLLQLLNESIRDRKVTAEEAEEITRELHLVNDRAERRTRIRESEK